jgi:hypothetical protein
VDSSLVVPIPEKDGFLLKRNGKEGEVCRVFSCPARSQVWASYVLFFGFIIFVVRRAFSDSVDIHSCFLAIYCFVINEVLLPTPTPAFWPSIAASSSSKLSFHPVLSH